MFKDTKLRALLNTVGKHNDGQGLYFVVSTPGHASWLLKFTINGRHRAMGLGSYPVVSAAMARDKAHEARKLIATGFDPINARKTAVAKQSAEPHTVASAWKAYVADMRSGWSEKYTSISEFNLERYIGPVIGKMPVNDVTLADVLKVLRPIWKTKTTTAERIRGQLCSVLDYSGVLGWRTGANPAAWKTVKRVLAKPEKVSPTVNHAALPWKEAQGFFASVRAFTGKPRFTMAARAVELVALTAIRTGPAILATWREIDFDARVWDIPGPHEKTGQGLTVPLSDRAIEILQAQRAACGAKTGPRDRVFPLLNSHDCYNFMRIRMKRGDLTVHGFRSTFRDWCGEATEFDTELAEVALSHVRGAVERAYARGKQLERRRVVMQTWANYLTGRNNIVELRTAA